MALTLVHSPFHGHPVVVGGRKRPVSVGPRFHVSRYLLGALPAPPAACDYSPKAMTSLRKVYLNDRYGCCVVSGAWHMVGVETGNAGSEFIATDDMIVHDYTQIGGFDINNPVATDNGCDENTALDFYQNRGFANGTKILGSMVVDGSSATQSMQAIELFENGILCAEFPDAWISPFPAGDGFVWDVAGPPNPRNGHSFTIYGYGPDGVKIVTWGMRGTLTWRALAMYCTPKAYGSFNVVLTPDQLTKGQTVAPNGFAWGALIADFDAMGGHVPLPPPPPPPPAPPPLNPPDPPHPPVRPSLTLTLDQAQAYATHRLVTGPPILIRSQALALVKQSLVDQWPK